MKINKLLIVLFILLSLVSVSAQESKYNIVVKKLNENRFQLNNIDTLNEGIPLNQLPMKREKDTSLISAEFEIIDFTYSGWLDTGAYFVYPQIIQIKDRKYNIDSIMYKRSKYKIEYDFWAADYYHIKSTKKELLFIKAGMRYLGHCVNCSNQIILMIDLNSDKYPMKVFMYNCIEKKCGILNLESIIRDRSVKILSKNVMGQYELEIIKL